MAFHSVESTRSYVFAPASQKLQWLSLSLHSSFPPNTSSPLASTNVHRNGRAGRTGLLILHIIQLLVHPALLIARELHKCSINSFAPMKNISFTWRKPSPVTYNICQSLVHFLVFSSTLVRFPYSLPPTDISLPASVRPIISSRYYNKLCLFENYPVCVHTQCTHSAGFA